LIAANQWATGRQRKDDVNTYIKIAESMGLVYGEEFIFTSEYKKEYETGISRRMLRELMLLGNIFIYPTREESFGLVGPEAAFSGNLIITNRSLNMMQEVLNGTPSYDFGSFTNKFDEINNMEYIQHIAMSIMNCFYLDESMQIKTHCRIRYNMDNIYKNFFLPAISY
jgi:hypothetical protein